jgi:TRAP-type C4-dicarboxylate transport system permease large subunit
LICLTNSKRYGIDPIQMGLVMVICNQIGAVSLALMVVIFVPGLSTWIPRYFLG